MLHHAVNDGIVGLSYARVHIAEHPMAGGVVQRVGVGGAAVAADKFPDNGLGRQLRIIGIHIKCIAAAVAVGQCQGHRITLIPAQSAPGHG